MRKLIGSAATIVWIAGAAHATTIVPIADAKLVDRSPIVVLATVEYKSSPGLDRPATDWTVKIDRVLKGQVGQGRIVVRLPGGETLGGKTLHIYGSPPLRPGYQAILFLKARHDGAFSLSDFPQGAFVAAKTGRRTLAIRDFSSVRVIDRMGRVGAREPFRDLRRFADWVEDRAAGIERLPNYLVQPTSRELKSVTSEFTFLTSGGLPIRWFDFDTGGSVTFKSHTTGMPGLSGGGVTQLQNGLALWTNEATTPVRYLYGGTTSASAGHTGNGDNENVVLWTDLNNEIDGTFDCGSGGTLAIGGPWFHPSLTGVFNGKTYRRALEGDVVFNDGVSCKQFTSPNFAELIEEIVSHELGHTLGLGHSSEKRSEPNSVLKQALMYAYAHDDSRGGVLNSDDIKGLQTMYRVGGPISGGGGGGGGGSVGCPAGTPPNTLCLLKGRFRVTGTWSNQFDGSSGTAIPITNTDLSGFFYFGDKSNIELILKILDSAGEVKVFYSQLTNLRFTLTVTDTTTNRTKTYSNTAGECGAIDLNFATGQAALQAISDGLESVTAPATASCVASTTTLCLLNRRFAITVDWRNQFNGETGVGRQKTLSILTGAFSFTDPANLEILIKTLDHGDNILVIYGSLSNLEYTIRVTDTATGAVKTYHNPAGRYCGGLDTNAF